jgi:hypothetical protein
MHALTASVMHDDFFHWHGIPKAPRLTTVAEDQQQSYVLQVGFRSTQMCLS